MRRDALQLGRKRISPHASTGAVFGLLSLGALLILSLTGCGGTAPRAGATVQEGSSEPLQASGSQATVPTASKRFEEPGELDKLLDAKPIALAAVKPASAAQPSGAAAKSPDPVSKGKGNFRIQVGAESDVDAAQAKKLEYEKTLGGSVDVVFDAPYYKLRWGWFDSKQDAEDKVLELSDLKIQMFVVKQ
jgi:septal ring-binding cell division protein DamX